MKDNTMTIPRKDTQASTVPFVKILFAKKAVYIAAQLICGVLAFFTARCTVLKYCSPFALALCCAVPMDFAPVSVLGAAAGYLTGGYEIIPLRYICALLIIIIARRLFFSEKFKNNPIAAGICGIFSTAVTGISASLILDEVDATMLIYALESFIVGASAVFLSQGYKTVTEMKSLRHLKDSELACLLLSAFLILLSLSYIKIRGFSPSRILAAVIVLLGAYYGKIGGGAVAGIGAGLVMNLGSSNPYIFICYAFGGVLAGLGASYNRFLSALAMLMSGAILAIVTSGKEIGFIILLELAVSAVIFLILPKKLLKKLSFLEGETYSVSLQGVKSHAVARLRFASDALGDVSASVNEVHDKLEKTGANKKSTVYRTTITKTCDRCGLKYYCWEQEKDYTVSVFKKVEKMLENETELTKENLPNNLGTTCIRSKALIKNFTLAYSNYITNTLAEKRTDDVRNVMAVQFDALSQLLFDLSDDIENKEILDTALTSSLHEILEYYDIPFNNAVVVVDASFRMKISINSAAARDDFFNKEMIKDFCEICSRTFSEPEITQNSDSVMVNFYEKSIYKTNIGFCQLNAENNTSCGDAFETLRDTTGRSVIILSDGMGNGASARVDGAMASSMLKNLIAAGFSVGAAIKVVNSALMVKSSEESFSTVDMAAIDLFNGKTDFYKAGATCSFVKRKGRVGRVELSSLPIGILREADFSHTNITLSDGDAVVLVSDGATQGNYEWITEIIENCSSIYPGELARTIAAQASKHQFGVHEDDITVIAAFIEKE